MVSMWQSGDAGSAVSAQAPAFGCVPVAWTEARGILSQRGGGRAVSGVRSSAAVLGLPKGAAEVECC